jgi:hypothetical protein
MKTKNKNDIIFKQLKQSSTRPTFFISAYFIFFGRLHDIQIESYSKQTTESTQTSYVQQANIQIEKLKLH